MQMQVMTHTEVVGSRVLGFRVDLAGCPHAPRASGRLVAVLFFQTSCVQWPSRKPSSALEQVRTALVTAMWVAT